MAERYGVLARFETAAALVAAVRALRADGHRGLEPFSPYPVAGLDEALGFAPRRLPLLALVAALAVGAAGYFMQWYSAAVDYPFVVGGKPLHYWAPFMLVTFALGILSAVLAGLFGMLAGNRLPQPYHPAFNVPEFDRASDDAFFVLVPADDPAFDPEATPARLRELAAVAVHEVPA